MSARHLPIHDWSTILQQKTKIFTPSNLVFCDYCQHYLKNILLVRSFPCFAGFQVLHKDNSFLAYFNRMHFETNFQESQHSSKTESSNINGERSHNHMLGQPPHSSRIHKQLSRDSNYGAHAAAFKLSSTRAFPSII